jgi:hypothetical protein
MRQFAPLYAVAGAPGAGKTTALPHLIELADGLVGMDIDELLDDGRLLGVLIADESARAIWPDYDRIWVRITTAVRRAGHPVLLLTPIPDEADFPAGFGFPPPVHLLHLDCGDECRSSRLRSRGWDEAKIADAVNDAAAGRRFIPDTLHSSAVTPTEVADLILAWIATKK